MDNKNAKAEDRELNILVVDDSAMMRAMIKRVVEICDFPSAHVLFAGNGREALQVLAEMPVSAVFTDINMPEMSGVEQRMLPPMRVNPSAGRLPRRAKDDERLRQAAVSVLETMFYRVAEVSQPGNLAELPAVKGCWLHSSVTFSGAFSGSVVCWL